jgi:E3 ubiquitin-protein ligase BRE1
MKNKRLKTDDRTARAVRLLDEMIRRENIISHQKHSLYLQMVEYKKTAEALRKRNEEVLNENSFLHGTLEAVRDENKENVRGATSSDEGSKAARLHGEIRDLTLKICELERQIKRKRMCSEPGRGTKSEGAVPAERQELPRDDGAYSKLVRESSELRAQLRLRSNEYQLKIEDLVIERDELRERVFVYSSEIEAYEKSRKAMSTEIAALKERLSEIRADGRGEQHRSLAARQELYRKLAESSADIEKHRGEVSLLERRVEDLLSDKESLIKIVEGYKRASETRAAVQKSTEPSFLEEEINNLVVTLDQSLEDSSRLSKEIEELHDAGSRLRGEVSVLKSRLSSLADERAKVDLEISELRMENKRFHEERMLLCSEAEEERSRCKRLSERIDETEATIAGYKKVHSEVLMEKGSLSRALDSTRRQNKELNDALAEASKKIHMLECESARSKAAISVLTRKTPSSTGDGGIDAVLDVEKYRSLLRCSLCDNRFKDTALVKCMHCFCCECIEGRVKCRDRRCPTCKESFSLNEVRRIFL